MEHQFDIHTIMKHLPHRYPFLLVDRILSLTPGESAVGLKNVTINEPFFQGHFPHMPVMPGVLIVEAMAQVGGVLYMVSLNEESPQVMYFLGINNARFRKPVVPGDQLNITVTFLKRRANVIKFSGEARVDGTLAAEAELMASSVEKK